MSPLLSFFKVIELFFVVEFWSLWNGFEGMPVPVSRIYSLKVTILLFFLPHVLVTFPLAVRKYSNRSNLKEKLYVVAGRTWGRTLLTCIPGGQEAEDSRFALFSVHSVVFTSHMCGNRTQFYCVCVFSLLWHFPCSFLQDEMCCFLISSEVFDFVYNTLIPRRVWTVSLNTGTSMHESIGDFCNC